MKKILIAISVVVLISVVSFAATMTQDFESSAFPPNGWSLAGSYTLWSRSIACSGFGTGTASAKADFYNVGVGRSQDLITIDLYPATATDSLKFDHAYATYSSSGGGEKDSLRISTSTDGGSVWTVLVDLPGGRFGSLNTGNYITSPFVPTAGQWATKTYTLPTGTNKIKFTALSQNGNNLYLDNVRVSYATLLHNVGVTSVTAPGGQIPGKVAVAPKATVKNDGSSTESFNTICKIDVAGGAEVYNQTLAVSNLVAGASQVLTFPNFTPDSGEYYNVIVWTGLVGDLFQLNDTSKSYTYCWYSINRVLAEFNTCTSCSPCVLANDSLNVVCRDLKDSMTCIRTHMWWPTNNDPFYLGRGPDTMENRARRTYYGFNVVPYMIIGGKHFPAYPYNEYRTTILSERKVPRPLTITLEGWYSASGDSGVITAVVNATGRFPSASKAGLTLRYAIIEDSVFYTGTNGDPEHFQILRDMIPDNNGIPISINKGQTVVNSQKFTIYTGGVIPYTWTEKNCQFVVYVQDDVTKEILQSATCGLNAIPPSAVELCSFTGMAGNGEVMLSWRTASEFDNYKWLIERSASPEDGFVQIGEVAAENNPNGHSYSYTDRTVQPYTDYYYRLGDKDIYGNITWNGSVLITSQGVAITKFWLAAGRPNPCRDLATFEYALPQRGEVSVRIFDICGRLVNTLPEGRRNAGIQKATWDLRDNSGKPVANGVYFFRMSAGEQTATRKITVLR